MSRSESVDAFNTGGDKPRPYGSVPNPSVRFNAILVGDGLVPSRRALTGALAVRLRELRRFDEVLGAFKTGGDKPRPYGSVPNPLVRFNAFPVGDGLVPSRAESLYR